MAILRFGPFDLDTRSGELRRGGLRVRLRPQPCAVLAYLAEHSGTFVSRQDLHHHLWHEGTFVHFDQGLNSCMKQVRRALGDNRRMPAYIETLPRRGYRFLVPVQKEDDGSAVGNGDLLSRLARAVARELSAVLATTGSSDAGIRPESSDAGIRPESSDAGIRRLELARVEEAARRALEATLDAVPQAPDGHRERQCVS
jgi:DNA-binding winged helix-turn-helix (wHTH) protein